MEFHRGFSPVYKGSYVLPQRQELHASRRHIKALRIKLGQPLTDTLFGIKVCINDAIEKPILVRKDADNRIVDVVELEV